MVLAAAGALSVAAVVSAAVTSWSAGNAEPGGPAGRSAGAASAAPQRLTLVAYQQHIAATAKPQHIAKKPAVAVSQSPTASPSASQSTPTPTPTATASSGTPQQTARGLLASFGWSSSQFACLNPLWEHESGWSVTAENAGSGAYGIPQAVPGSRMSSAGPDWQTNATTQIKWGLRYIKSTYGSPCAAYAHEQATGWY